MSPNRWRFHCLALISLACASVAVQGGTYLNTFETVANLAQQGDTVTVTVKFGCDMGEDMRESYRLRVTVSQRGTGAVAEGDTSGFCTGDRSHNTSQSISVTARIIGDASFDPSRGATPAGLAVTFTRDKGTVQRTDVQQWVPNFELSLQ